MYDELVANSPVARGPSVRFQAYARQEQQQQQQRQQQGQQLLVVAVGSEPSDVKQVMCSAVQEADAPCAVQCSI